jgi:hypothetical protein
VTPEQFAELTKSVAAKANQGTSTTISLGAQLPKQAMVEASRRIAAEIRIWQSEYSGADRDLDNRYWELTHARRTPPLTKDQIQLLWQEEKTRRQQLSDQYDAKLRETIAAANYLRLQMLRGMQLSADDVAENVIFNAAVDGDPHSLDQRKAAD